MSITICDYPNVSDRCRQLGCFVPEGLAILPHNFATAEDRQHLLHESEAATVRVLFRNEGITETRIEPLGEKFPCVQQNDFTWVGPIIFFGAAQLAQDPGIISVSLGVIANYLTDFFRGVVGGRRVHFEAVIEQTKTKRHVHVQFDGDLEAFRQLPSTLMELIHDDRESSPLPRGTEPPSQ